MPRAPSHVPGVTRYAVTSQCHVSGHYSTFIATTNPCARPKASHRFQSSLYGGSLQVVANPCWLMVLPDVISAILV